MRSSIDSQAIRIRQILFGLVILYMAYTTVRSMMGGTYGRMPYVSMGLVLGTLILWLDKQYWMLFPLAFLTRGSISLPGFEVLEVSCMVIIGTHFVRRALRRETHTRFRPAVLWAVPYFIWVVVVYLMNPSGIYLFGSGTIGARFYLKILLGFWATVVMSFQQVEEADCRKIVRISVAVVAVSLTWNFIIKRASVDASTVSAYELLGAAPLFFWLHSRFRITQLLRVGWKPLAAIWLTLMTIFTGKRRAVFNILVFPVIRALIARRDRGATLVLSTIFAVVLGIIVAGQGFLYELPLSMQRGLSMLPGRWDSSLTAFEGGKDPFREIVKEYAWEEIRRDPWFGRKGFAINLEEIKWVSSSGSTNYREHGVAGNWHSTWIGMMADFGIPGAVGWAIFSIGMLWTGFQKLKECAADSYQQTVVIYCLGSFILNLLASNTSGHSALVPFFIWPTFGLILAISPSSASENDSPGTPGLRHENPTPSSDSL